MAGPVLYSTNPWYAAEVSEKYRKGMYFAWISDYFDSSHAPSGSAGSLIAPSSNPRKIYGDLLLECDAQEEHSRIIKAHKSTFARLAKKWHSDGDIDTFSKDEIISSVKSSSWKIWKPVLYVIPRPNIDPSRIITVPRPGRAGYGPEYQIVDLKRAEFDIVDLSGLVR